MKTSKMIMLAILLVGLTGCGDAYVGKWATLGRSGTVTLYSGGKAVRSWISAGIIHIDNQSHGYYFIDKTTGHLIHVSGNVGIEQ